MKSDNVSARRNQSVEHTRTDPIDLDVDAVAVAKEYGCPPFFLAPLLPRPTLTIDVADRDWIGRKGSDDARARRRYVYRTIANRSNLRQTAIHEHFTSCHKTAVIGGEEQGHGGGFIRVAHTTEWRLIGETSKECLLHSRPR
jgi:hypothetical protein